MSASIAPEGIESLERTELREDLREPQLHQKELKDVGSVLGMAAVRRLNCTRRN